MEGSIHAFETGPWGSMMDLSIGKQAKISSNTAGAASVSKQKAQKAKEVASKEKGKEKETPSS